MTALQINKYMTLEQWRTGAYVEVTRGSIRATSNRGETRYIVGLTTVADKGLMVYVELTGNLMPIETSNGKVSILDETLYPSWGREGSSEFISGSCRYKMGPLSSESELDSIIADLVALDASLVADDEREYLASFVSRKPTE